MVGGEPGARVEVFVVWIPMQKGDSAEAARETGRLFEDTSVQQFWDGKRALGRLIAGSVNIEPAVIAWDIYLGYDASAVIGDRVPAPVDWVHQLGGVEPQRYRGGRITNAVMDLAARLLRPETRPR